MTSLIILAIIIFAYIAMSYTPFGLVLTILAAGSGFIYLTNKGNKNERKN